MRPLTQLEVVVDVDGVLADFEGHFCARFGTDHRDLVNLEKRYPWCRDAIQKFVKRPDTYRHLKPLRVGVEIARWLREEQNAILHIVSSRPLGTYEITQHWLRDNRIPYTSLTVRPDKLITIKALQPHFLLDDIISVVEGCYQQWSIPGILVAHPWNETSFFPRVESRDEFVRVFNRLVDTYANISLSRSHGTDGLA